MLVTQDPKRTCNQARVAAMSSLTFGTLSSAHNWRRRSLGLAPTGKEAELVF